MRKEFMLMYRFLLVSFVCLLSFFKLHAQCPVPAPVPQCTQVDGTTGDVTIVFDVAAGPTYNPAIPGPESEGFTHYEIQRAIGSSVIWDSIGVIGPAPWGTGGDINTGTYTHVGALGNTQQNRYRIITHSFCGVPGNLSPAASPPSVEISTILLNTTITDDTVITLTWNQNQRPDPGFDYQISRDFPTNGTFIPYILSGISFGMETYNDTIHTCDDTSVYVVTLPTNTCQNISSVDSAFLKDLTPPSLQLIDSVTFNFFHDAPTLGWTASDHLDVMGYIVWDCENGGVNIRDSVFGRTNTYFLDTALYTGTSSVQYSIDAFDFCGNTSSVFGRECFNSMFLTTEVNLCDETIELVWNPYDDFASGIDVSYDIYVSQGGLPYQLIGTTKDIRFLHEDPVKDATLRYFVRAVENGGNGPLSATSNQIEIETAFLQSPDFSYLRNVSVIGPNQVSAEMYIDLEGDMKEYRLRRSTDSTENYVTIATVRRVRPYVPADSLVARLDETALTDINRYYYTFQAVDSCGRILSETNYVSSLLLKVIPDNAARTNTLVWNNQVGWDGDVFGYKVYREQDGVMDPDPIITVFPEPGETTTYIDDVNGLTDGAKGEFCYYIEAIEDEPTFPRLDPVKSLSNKACVFQQPSFHIPNAFTPEGNNPIFKPVFVYTDFDQYELKIFNRHGELVYETTNIDAGWDGRFGNKVSPTGIYVYRLKYRSVSGQKFEKSGTLTLIK